MTLRSLSERSGNLRSILSIVSAWIFIAFSRKALITGTTPSILTHSLCESISSGICPAIVSAAN